MRAVGTMAWALLLSVLVCQPAFADKRIALVIGNSAYRNVARLTNPANDAAAMAETFRKAHFDVVDSRTDLTVLEMRRVLRDFGAKARDADIAVIYYAGHGIELEGTNYLIPVDAQLETDTDVYDETLPLDRLLVAVDPAKQLRLIILDACRDNPFSKTMKRTVAMRSIGRGLAKVEPSNPNTMIAFAAKAGFTASDGDSRNSPFAVALAQHLTTPGLDLRKAFGFVRDDVLKATNNQQEPFIYGSLGGNDVALVPPPSQPAAAPAAAAAPDPNSALRRDYELAAQVGTKEAWDYFLSTYPEGFYAKLAQAQRDKLAAEEQARLAAEGAKAAEQAKAAALAKAAEQARVAAEKKKAAEEAKVAEAERAKAEQEAKTLAAKAKAAEDVRLAAEKKAAEDARLAEAKRAKVALNEKPIGPVAALTPPSQPEAAASSQVATDIPRLLQAELRRVGCNTGAVDGEWNAAAQKALAMFNKHAGTTLDVKLASLDALDMVRSKTIRICPLICDRGYKADGERCVKISCGAGFFLNDDNECEKKKPQATREEPPARREKPKSEQVQSAPAKPQAQASGQVFCNQQGCRPVSKGCYIGRGREGSSFSGGQREVCF